MVGIVLDPHLLQRICAAVFFIVKTRCSSHGEGEQIKSSIVWVGNTSPPSRNPQYLCKEKLPSINTKRGTSAAIYRLILLLIKSSYYFSHDGMPNRSIIKRVFSLAVVSVPHAGKAW